MLERWQCDRRFWLTPGPEVQSWSLGEGNQLEPAAGVFDTFLCRITPEKDGAGHHRGLGGYDGTSRPRTVMPTALRASMKGWVGPLANRMKLVIILNFHVNAEFMLVTIRFAIPASLFPPV
jgi:hypothetical protein